MRSVINSKTTLAASIALHAFGALAFWSSSRSALPIGARRAGDAEVVEIGLVGHRAVARRERGPTVKERPAPTKPATEGLAQVAKFGFADGVQSEERLGVANGVEAGERERYLFELRVLLEGRKIYPKVSRYMNESGRVTVRFKIQQDGRIEGVEVVRPSAFERLNHAAHELVTGLARYKPLPAGANEAMSVELPIEYLLR